MPRLVVDGQIPGTGGGGGGGGLAPAVKILGVDFKADAVTPLYTVPAGEVFIVTHTEYHVVTAVAVTGVSTIAGIGVAAGEDDIQAPVSFNGLATGKVYGVYAMSARMKALAGQTISLGIDTFATATTLLIDVYLFGYFESALSVPVSSAGGDTTAIHDDTPNEISGIVDKPVLALTDLMLVEDSAAAGVKKKATVGAIPDATGSAKGMATAAQITKLNALPDTLVSQAVAEAGSDNTPFLFSSLRVAQAVAAQTRRFISFVEDVDGDWQNLTDPIPYDDSIPISNEGTQVLGVASPGLLAGEVVQVEGVVYVGADAARHIIVEVKVDTVIRRTAIGYVPGGGVMIPIPFHYNIIGGVQSVGSAITVAIGPADAGNCYFNGINTGRKLGGSLSSYLQVTRWGA